MSLLVILGNDKLGGLALSKIVHQAHLHLQIDLSSNYRRVIRLVGKGVLSIDLVIKMFFAECKRGGRKPSGNYPGIQGNSDLIKSLSTFKPTEVVLFRAGLIVSKEVLGMGIPIYNIHAARVPEYGGLGSIARALKDGALEQFASLHEVTSKIDEGKLLDSENFLLSPKASYFENEQTAYSAAIRLLIRRVQAFQGNERNNE